MLNVLAEIVRCPNSSLRTAPISDPQREDINERIRTGSLLHADGTPVRQPLESALITDDGRFAYRVDHGIAALLPQLAIDLEDERRRAERLHPDKEIVQRFYETFGWKKQGDQYLDTLTFVDRRPASMRYLQLCHRRVRRQLPHSGRFMLDAASGPVQYDEYRHFSEAFDYRVCIDFSAVALREAQVNLGVRGLYVLGDVTQLPFRDEVFDAVVSLHTIYHIPAAEQRRAFLELHRVLHRGGTAVVVYEWNRRRIMSGVWRKFLRITLGSRRRQPSIEGGTESRPTLYWHPHTYRWFRDQDWPFEMDVRVWRLVGGAFLRRYVRGGVLGAFLVWLLYGVEELAPRVAGRVGRYPMILIRKA